jgi:hypothetical protein
MAGLVQAIHVFVYGDRADVDARDKRGHDAGECGSVRGTREVRGESVGAFLT